MLPGQPNQLRAACSKCLHHEINLAVGQGQPGRATSACSIARICLDSRNPGLRVAT